MSVDDCKFVECYLICWEDVKYSVMRQYGLILCANGLLMAPVCWFFNVFYFF